MKTTGMLSKMLQMGVQVEEDDADFELPIKPAGQDEQHLHENNIVVDGLSDVHKPKIVDGRRMPTLHEVLADDDFLAELRQGNEALLKL